MPEPSGDPAGRRTARFIAGVATPLAIVALAYTLWWISDRLLYIGPLDRAAFGWVVVIPLWLAAPVAAGFAWQVLPTRRAVLAAVLVGSTIGGVAAGLFWQAIINSGCEYGSIRAPSEWIVPALMLGLLIGGGLAVSGLVATAFARNGRPWRAVVLGAGAEIVGVFAAILVTSLTLMSPVCERPPV